MKTGIKAQHNCDVKDMPVTQGTGKKDKLETATNGEGMMERSRGLERS